MLLVRGARHGAAQRGGTDRVESPGHDAGGPRDVHGVGVRRRDRDPGRRRRAHHASGVRRRVRAAPRAAPRRAPPRRRDRTVPRVIYLHAGGWIAGDRTVIPDFIAAQVERGIALVSVDYRLVTTAADGTFRNSF